VLTDLLPISRQLLELNQRDYERCFIKDNDLSHRLSIVLGQRGVGKSTALSQYALQQFSLRSEKLLYVPVDHFLFRQNSLYEIAEDFYQHGGELIFFDEIHKSIDWSISLKSIYDSFPNLHVLASGSAALEILKGSHDLSRRAIFYHMKDMFFREYIEMKYAFELPSFTLSNILKNHTNISEKITHEIENKKLKILACFKEYLKIGYYPYFNEFTNPLLFYKTLEQNIHASIESDITSIHSQITGTTIRKLKQLLNIIAREVPFTADMNSLKNRLDIGDIRTLKIYLKYLEDAGLMILLNKGKSGVKNIEKPDKIYLNNTAQLHALSAPHDINIGTAREIFFASMLRHIHQINSAIKGDFLIDDTYLIEVCGRKKGFSQIKNQENAFLACDDIEHGALNKIPLWLFGFLY